MNSQVFRVGITALSNLVRRKEGAVHGGYEPGSGDEGSRAGTVAPVSFLNIYALLRILRDFKYT